MYPSTTRRVKFLMAQSMTMHASVCHESVGENDIGRIYIYMPICECISSHFSLMYMDHNAYVCTDGAFVYIYK
jgi:hypothetical protein